MSDRWEYFPCAMGDNTAFIFVDVGIHDIIHEAPRTVCKVRLKYRHTHPSGLPTNDDFEPAKQIEDRLEAFASAARDWYVGRVTVDGHRYFHYFTTQQKAAWVDEVSKLSHESGFELTVLYEDDPDHDAYLKELYPTQDDWRVISDMRVIDGATENGDDNAKTRQIDHWIYFDDERAAYPFIAWAKQEGYIFQPEYSESDEDGRYCVRVCHHGTLELNDITHHTLSLAHKAEEFGGDYDGWETPIVEWREALTGGYR